MTYVVIRAIALSTNHRNSLAMCSSSRRLYKRAIAAPTLSAPLNTLRIENNPRPCAIFHR